MLNSYLNQTAEFTPAGRNEDGSARMNNRGEIEYLPPVVVSCRKRYKTQEMITADGQIVKATWIYYMTRAPRIDDLIDGMRVQLVSDWVGLGGAVIGYKAVV